MLTHTDKSYEYKIRVNTSIDQVRDALRQDRDNVEDLILDVSRNSMYTEELINLGFMSQLESLDITGPGLLSGLFPNYFRDLTIIDVKDQQITSVQEFIDIAPESLSVLIMSGNLIQQVCFNKIYDLEYLDLSNNQLNYICGLQNLSDLDTLLLQNNMLKDIEIPNNIREVNMDNQLFKHPSSKMVILSNREMTIDEILVKATKLLNVTDLTISGGYGRLTIGMLKMCPYLTSLSIIAGQFAGGIPEMSYFRLLERLTVSSQSITEVDTLIEYLPYMKNLRTLDLSSNLLTEFILPDEFYYLDSINLANNRLHTVDGLQHADNLLDINLAFNDLTSIPQGLYKVNMNISDNDLNGHVVADIRGAKWILSYNDITFLSSTPRSTGIIVFGEELSARDIRL